MSGIFVSLEGIDGCGKSTQLTMLARSLSDAGLEVVRVREPGGTSLGESVRDLLLEPRREDAPMDPVAETLLFSASRAQLVAEVIRPALARGAIVLADRFADSTTAYQGAGRGIEEIEQLNRFAVAGTFPDATVVIDVPIELALARRASQGTVADRIEDEDAQFHARVREGFLAAARREPDRIRIVDGSGSAADVHTQVTAALPELFATSTAT